VKLHEIGENQLVARLTRGLALGRDVRVGAGDDCAVLGSPRAARWELLKTDAVVEGVHFESGEKMERVGWKALCRAASDIAAMGGLPAHALVTLAAPADCEIARLDAFYRGLKKAAKRCGISIVGGETARSPGPLFVSVTLTGWVERKFCTLRSGGRNGDGIYVTGRLGGSRRGKHLDFVPRLAEARWLVAHTQVSAMMDLSDGLGQDLPRLSAASRSGYELWEQSVPRTRGCTVTQALGDGEDFELLFTVAPRAEAALLPRWKSEFPRLPLTKIGRLTPIGEVSCHVHGFDHFT
jgi:thiamine-monophosphate kinase